MLLETIQTILLRLRGLRDMAFEALVLPTNIDQAAPEDAGQTVVFTGTARNFSTVLPENTPPAVPEDEDQVNNAPNQYQSQTVPDDGVGIFSFAHDFVVNNPTIISQIMNSGDLGLRILGEKRMIGAQVDSSARQYAPRCHPQTRISLRSRIIDWIERRCDSGQVGERREHAQRMLWVLGPAGVGKSAVAQSIAERMKERGQLGATLFFSRPNGRDDPEKVIPTLAYQLAVKHPKYKPILNQMLADDPTILEKTLRVQFKELIVDPFYTLMARDSSTLHRPLLIVLDGLDECRSEEAQCEFIEMITEHVRSVHEFPLIWMVCSRPEWHFRYLLSRPDFPATCRREQMMIDDPEARQDVALFLRDEFAHIHRRFLEYLPPIWPPESALRIIILKASGLFALAAVVVRFIGDPVVDDPNGQLQICLDALSGSTAGPKNPLGTLDILYAEICSRISPLSLPTTKRILAVCAWYSDSTPLPAQNMATLLGLDRAGFYRSLKQLHSVLEIPCTADACSIPVRFYHASFQDFLREPKRSATYTVSDEALHLDIATMALNWQINKLSNCNREPGWSNGSDLPMPDGLTDFCMSAGLKACSRVVNKAAGRSLVMMLGKLDFRTLKPDVDWFPEFLLWLYSTKPAAQVLFHVQKSNCLVHHSTNGLHIRGPTLDECRRLFSRARGSPNRLPTRLHLGLGRKMCELRFGNVACNSCRARKTKCDGDFPACASCARRQVPCVYAEDMDGNNNPSASITGNTTNRGDSNNNSLSSSHPNYYTSTPSNQQPPFPGVSRFSSSSDTTRASLRQRYGRVDNGLSHLLAPPSPRAPSTTGGSDSVSGEPDVVDQHMVPGHHRSYPSFHGGGSTRDDRGVDPMIRSDDEVMDRRDGLISVGSRGVAFGGVGTSLRRDLKRPLSSEHLSRDVDADMRLPPDSNTIGIDDTSYHPSTYSIHSSHSDSYSAQQTSQDSVLRRDMETRAVKKMRMEDDEFVFGTGWTW